MPDPTLDDLVDFHDQFQLDEKPTIPRATLAYENEKLKQENENLRALVALSGWTN